MGVVDVHEDNVAYKGQLNPGKLLVDFESHKVVENNELKVRIANQYPYKEWLESHKVDLNLEAQTYHQPLLKMRHYLITASIWIYERRYL